MKEPNIKFSEWIEEFSQRIHKFRRHIGQDPVYAKLPADSSTFELQTVQEELSAAEEELRMQNEHLQTAFEEVDAERKRYRELFEFSQDGCIVSDIKGVIVEANSAAGRMLGVPCQYLTGKPLIRCLDGESHGLFRAELRQIQQTHGTSEITVRIQPRAAASFYAALTLSAMMGDGHHLQGVRWLLRDVTEEFNARQQVKAMQEQTQQQLMKHNEELEKTCRAKDQELERERNARQEAETARAAKDRLLATVTHELRAPLTPVLASLDTLQRDAKISPHLRSALGLIRRNIDIQSRLINDLLDMVKIGYGKLLLNLHPQDLHALVNDALDVCQAEIKDKSLILDLHLNAKQHTVSGDAVRLQQVFWNIIKNAIKFSHAHGQVVHCNRQPHPGSRSPANQGYGNRHRSCPAFQHFRCLRPGRY